MKNLILITILTLSTLATDAQRLVIGSKVPDLKGVQWLNGAPSSSRSAFIEFYQSTNSTSKQYFPKLKIVKELNPNITIIVLVRESNEVIDKLVAEHGSNYYFAYDADGSVYESFGVKFVPFSMIIDPKGNLQWQGNLLQLTPETVKNAK